MFSHTLSIMFQNNSGAVDMYVTSIYKTKPIDVESVTGNVDYKGVTVRYLLPSEIGVNYEMRYVEIGLGGSTSYDYHYWEHYIFVVKGEGIFYGGGKKIRVKAGSAIYIYPNEIHRIWNDGDIPLGIICIVPRGTPEDNVRIELKEKLEKIKHKAKE